MTPVDGGHGMLTVGSCAAEHHEPGQIRKEAALSGSFRVTQGGLARVHAHHRRRREVSTAGARSPSLPSEYSERVARAPTHQRQEAGFRSRTP